MTPNPNRILIALMATKIGKSDLTNYTYLSPEEIVFARGELVATYPTLVIDTLLSGIDVGLHYADIFGIPEKRLMEDVREEFQWGLKNDLAMRMRENKDFKNLLGDSDE